jgi:hypothetical protein
MMVLKERRDGRPERSINNNNKSNNNTPKTSLCKNKQMIVYPPPTAPNASKTTETAPSNPPE